MQCPGQLHTGAWERPNALTFWSRPRGRRLRKKSSLRGKLSNSKPQGLREEGLQSMMLGGWVLSPALSSTSGPRWSGAGKAVAVGLGWF